MLRLILPSDVIDTDDPERCRVGWGLKGKPEVPDAEGPVGVAEPLMVELGERGSYACVEGGERDVILAEPDAEAGRAGGEVMPELEEPNVRPGAGRVGILGAVCPVLLPKRVSLPLTPPPPLDEPRPPFPSLPTYSRPAADARALASIAAVAVPGAVAVILPLPSIPFPEPLEPMRLRASGVSIPLPPFELSRLISALSMIPASKSAYVALADRQAEGNGRAFVLLGEVDTNIAGEEEARSFILPDNIGCRPSRPSTCPLVSPLPIVSVSTFRWREQRRRSGHQL